MKFNADPNGINKLIKWGIPILGLVVIGPVGCLVGILIASCLSVSGNSNG